MGFLSKKKDEGEESSRNALFGSRKKSDKGPAQSNPCMWPPGASDDTADVP
jgi:hypothetical protein